MPQEPPFSDFVLLNEASRALLGYFVHTWYRHYLGVITAGLERLHRNGLIRTLAEPVQPAPVSLDFSALDLEKITYINGIYFYILCAHKGANFRLMHRQERKQVLYLRGYDFEGSLATGGGMAMGFSSADTFLFNATMGELLSPHCEVFKVMSPKDVYWETVSAQRFFYGDFEGMIHLASTPIRSVFLNALHWKEGVATLLDRMDHFVVYVSSVTESALWELDQLDTDERRGRVTVVFDEDAIGKKVIHLGAQAQLHAKFGHLVWSKERPPDRNVADLRAHLSQRFVLTTPDDFKRDIEDHRRRIAGCASRLPPGARETWLDFRFFPALDETKRRQLHDFTGWVQETVATATATRAIPCLPLFLAHIQLLIFMTLLLGDHHQTGRALAAYGGLMQGAIDFAVSHHEAIAERPEGTEDPVAMLRDHLAMAEHIGSRMLSFGKSHEFDDISARATADFATAFDATKAAVAAFFEALPPLSTPPAAGAAQPGRRRTPPRS